VRKYACCDIRRYLCLVPLPRHYQDSEIREEGLGMQNANRHFVGKLLCASKTNLVRKKKIYLVQNHVQAQNNPTDAPIRNTKKATIRRLFSVY
jgi:hypothetical protein